MVAKKTGIYADLLIHPGETILDVIMERNITQKELAKRTGVSEAFLSDVINGKKDISRGLAVGLEYALSIPSSFWLNLQANYDSELISLQKEQSVDSDELSVLDSIAEVVDYLIKLSLIPTFDVVEQTVLALREYFQISSLSSLKKIVPTGLFRLSDDYPVDDSVIGAWLCICKRIASCSTVNTVFDVNRVDELVEKIKRIMMQCKGDPQKPLIRLFAENGIDFCVIDSFRGAPVHGYISSMKNGSYQLVLTILGNYADVFWFSLFHELGHIVNGNVSRVADYIDAKQGVDSEKEKKADDFARASLLDPSSYEVFLNKGDYSYQSVKDYSISQGVPSYIVIGRLQKDRIIPKDRFNKYKISYSWK